MLEFWVEELAAQLPGFMICPWNGLFDEDSVEYIVGWAIDARWSNSLPKLKAIVSFGSGVDHIKHLNELRDDVAVIRTVSEDLVQRMREFVAMSVLVWHRGLPEMIRNQRRRFWMRCHAEPASRISVGVMGYGGMGRAACDTLHGLGYRVSAWAKSMRTGVDYAYYAGDGELDEFVNGLDAVVCMLPLTSETRGILSRRIFERMNRGGCVVNVGRGDHVVEQDLLAALESGQLSQAVLDVFPEEPLTNSSPFWVHENVLVTSHSASFISTETGSTLIAGNILAFDSGDCVTATYNRDCGY